MADIDTDPAWHRFNLHSVDARVPGGEMILRPRPPWRGARTHPAALPLSACR
jgi:hypothetical protein